MWDVFQHFSDNTVYASLALAGTLLFVLRMILMLVGMGHDGGMDGAGDFHDGDVGGHDAPGHAAGHDDAAHHGGASGFQLLSVQSVLAFLMGAGWAGLAARREWGLGIAWGMLAAAVFGWVMMLFAAGLSFYMRKLANEPHYDMRTCIGTRGRVYLTIPEKGKGMGQVEVDVSGRRKIVEAASVGPAIPAFTAVSVVALDDMERLVVEVAK